MSAPRVVRAPRGAQRTCKNWLIEAAYRMIQNNLDPEVAERPQDLVVYGGRGQAARSWEAFDAILESLKNLEEDETLLVQSGKPVAVFRTHPDAPRVLIANSNLVPRWATWEHFDELARKGLIMYGQMTAGSWIYIGTQGILQGTYETFGDAGASAGWGSLKGKFCLTAGLGGMGGAQPLAITMNEGVGLIVEVDRERAERRRAIGYLDTVVDDLEEAMTLVEEHVSAGKPLSIGLIGNAADVYSELAAKGVTPDVVTDQTSAHEALMYVPSGLTVEAANQRASATRRATGKWQWLRWRGTCRPCWSSSGAGPKCSITATTSASRLTITASRMPLRSPASSRPTSARCSASGNGPFRWVALSGDPEDIYATDQAILELFPEDEHLRRWLTMAREKCRSRGCQRAFAGWAMANAPAPA